MAGQNSTDREAWRLLAKQAPTSRRIPAPVPMPGWSLVRPKPTSSLSKQRSGPARHRLICECYEDATARLTQLSPSVFNDLSNGYGVVSLNVWYNQARFSPRSLTGSSKNLQERLYRYQG